MAPIQLCFIVARSTLFLAFESGLLAADNHHSCHSGLPAGGWLLRAQHPGVDQLDPLVQLPLLVSNVVIGLFHVHKVTISVRNNPVWISWIRWFSFLFW